MSRTSLAPALLAVLASCAGAAAGEPVRWVASTEGSRWQERTVASDPVGEPDLEILPARLQRVEGFGGCFNEIGWQALSWLGEAERRVVLSQIFDPQEGLRFNFCRVPIGANDYALEWYSLDETEDDFALKDFSIARDERTLIPYVKAAMAIRPDLKLFASPWSPPTWMKRPKAYNHGRLRQEQAVLDAYALYFVKFVRAYAAHGLSVAQVHVQNEPDSDQKFPSCQWSGAEMRDFVRDHLGPLFAREGLPTEIWLGTIERADVNGWTHVVLGDPAARAYVKGVGFQWAGKGAVQRVHESFPDLPLMQTENECGDGQNTWDYALYVASLMKHYFMNGVSRFVYWNMVLPAGGESTWGWKQNSMVTVDPKTKAIAWQPEFYAMKHLTRFVSPGARVAGVTRFWAANAIAFENPDGERVVFVTNPWPEPRPIAIGDGPTRIGATLDARSFNTIVWKP
ncbi:MAG TPA: glycoside hydrolase family 30 beta sandwich domain-containing protein [Vicinamibacteria bacterium]|nr:glycoside hydrolase family 30 beta sandwich domain-containing protein [Vicinamibacteria bacterium]